MGLKAFILLLGPTLSKLVYIVFNVRNIADVIRVMSLLYWLMPLLWPVKQELPASMVDHRKILT